MWCHHHRQKSPRARPQGGYVDHDDQPASSWACLLRFRRHAHELFLSFSSASDPCLRHQLVAVSAYLPEREQALVLLLSSAQPSRPLPCLQPLALLLSQRLLELLFRPEAPDQPLHLQSALPAAVQPSALLAVLPASLLPPQAQAPHALYTCAACALQH